MDQQPDRSASSDEVRRLDRLRRTAQGFVERNLPTSAQLPVAPFRSLKEDPPKLLAGQQRCTALAARNDDWPLLGMAPTAIECGLAAGHPGEHRSWWHREFPRRRWRIYEWEDPHEHDPEVDGDR